MLCQVKAAAKAKRLRLTNLHQVARTFWDAGTSSSAIPSIIKCARIFCHNGTQILHVDDTYHEVNVPRSYEESLHDVPNPNRMGWSVTPEEDDGAREPYRCCESILSNEKRGERCEYDKGSHLGMILFELLSVDDVDCSGTTRSLRKAEFSVATEGEERVGFTNTKENVQSKSEPTCSLKREIPKPGAIAVRGISAGDPRYGSPSSLSLSYHGPPLDQSLESDHIVATTLDEIMVVQATPVWSRRFFASTRTVSRLVMNGSSRILPRMKPFTKRGESRKRRLRRLKAGIPAFFLVASIIIAVALTLSKRGNALASYSSAHRNSIDATCVFPNGTWGTFTELDEALTSNMEFVAICQGGTMDVQEEVSVNLKDLSICCPSSGQKGTNCTTDAIHQLQIMFVASTGISAIGLSFQ